MIDAEHPQPAPQSVEKIARENQDVILTAVADGFHERIATLTVIAERSFVSEVDGTTSFWVQNSNGAYGVNGTVNERGALTNITVTKISLSDAA